MLDLVFAGRKASLYGWKFVFLVLYIGQVAVPTLSLSALCEWAFSKRHLGNRGDGRGWSTVGLGAASDDALWGQDLPIMRQHSLLRQLKNSRTDLGNRPMNRWVACNMPRTRPLPTKACELVGSAQIEFSCAPMHLQPWQLQVLWFI